MSDKAHDDKQCYYPRDNALELARSKDVLALAWKAGFGNETLKHPDQALLARSFLAIAGELEYRESVAPSAGVRRSESGEAFLGENDYRETLIEQQDYLRRLKHRADVRGGPDVSAMGIADEAIARIEELLDGHKPPSAIGRTCPENNLPCERACLGGWCQTMFGFPPEDELVPADRKIDHE